MLLASRLPQMLNINPTDSRCYDFLNEAIQRTLQKGKYWGTIGRYSVSVTSQIMSLPPSVDTIEKVAISRVITPYHDKLYEFLEYGWGTRDDSLPNGSGVWEVLERGSYPTMVDIPSPGGTLTLKCDLPGDVGKLVTLIGYDTSGNWATEVVALAQGAGTNTVTSFASLVGVQPPLSITGLPTLTGQWWLYRGTITGTLLSNYQRWEISPLYNRYLIPFINSTITTVELIGKLAFVPVSNPTDYPVIQNMAALKLACRAIKAEEESDWATANLLWNGGKDKKTGVDVIGVTQELENELAHYLGDGREIGINITNSGYGNDPVPVIV
jgi:hypothetical protein